jgi:nucleolar protein 56
MDKFCPNIKAVCDVMVAASLIEHAGSLKRLSILPSSTIQILGAEKALFRHMKTGAKPPKHGIIVNHSLIAKSPDKMHGKIARAVADKISIAAKVDYFQGKFIGDKLRKELDEKFK